MLSYRRERGEWQEAAVDGDRRSFTLTALKCGSAYQVRVAATNSVGRGSASHTVSCKTQGGPPQPARQVSLPPPGHHLVTTTCHSSSSLECHVEWFTLYYSLFEEVEKLTALVVLLKQK